MESYRHLSSPIRIGAMTLRNRMVMSAMTTNYGSADFEVTERLMRYHEARARGGVGLITVEMCSVDVAQRYQPQSLSLGDDRFIAGHRELVARVHAHGARIQPQISHPGPESMTDPVGPSVNVNAGTGWPSRVLEREEIERIVAQYGDAAVRAREAGYDGMELHAAHGYMLLGSFLCPVRNRREDEYTGATVEGRTRLLLRVIRHIKERAGADFPITLRISGNEDAFDGRELNDTQLIAPLLEQAGIDAFQVSGGVSHDKIVAQIVCGSQYRDGYNTAVAAAVRKVVNVPVMVVGRIHDPALAEKIIADGDADMVAMARPLLADPELPAKVLSGRTNEIRRCLSCQNCIDSMLIAPFDANMNCAVNAQSGREAELAINAGRRAQARAGRRRRAGGHGGRARGGAARPRGAPGRARRAARRLAVPCLDRARGQPAPARLPARRDEAPAGHGGAGSHAGARGVRRCRRGGRGDGRKDGPTGDPRNGGGARLRRDRGARLVRGHAFGRRGGALACAAEAARPARDAARAAVAAPGPCARGEPALPAARQARVRDRFGPARGGARRFHRAPRPAREPHRRSNSGSHRTSGPSVARSS